MTSHEIVAQGKTLYAERLRERIETPDNIGKLVSINVETGDYEIGEDRDADATLRLLARQKDAPIYTHRIGYNAAYALGGVVERVMSQ